MLSSNTHSHLGDKLYERRKLGALEVEQLVKEFAKNNEVQKIRDLILQIDFLEYEKLDLKYLVEYKQKRYGDTLLIFFQPKKEVTL